MNAGLKKLAVTLTITAILLSLTQANMKVVSSSDTSRKIDLFTQKIPFNGMGINRSSDAFGFFAIMSVFIWTLLPAAGALLAQRFYD